MIGARGQHTAEQNPSACHGCRAAAASAAWGLGAWMSVLGLASSAALAEGQQDEAATHQSLTVELPGGSKVEVLTPVSGDWEVKMNPAKPSAGIPEAISFGGPFDLPPPPYPLDALEPYMSRSTLEYHWGKHHRTYCENLNKQVAGSSTPVGSLKDVVMDSWNGGKTLPAFNNAAQVWNHTFFWDSMKPAGGGAPAAGPLADAIERDFGSLDALRNELQMAGLTQFGSGWAWLVCDDEGTLKVFKTANAVPPFVSGWVPLLTIDVWEHAYYLDHQNRRGDYITLFLDHLVNWEKVAQRYEQATTDA